VRGRLYEGFRARTTWAENEDLLVTHVLIVTRRADFLTD
jgi:hypothetical protein